MQNAVDEGKKAGDKIKNSSQEAARSFQDSFISGVDKVTDKLKKFGTVAAGVFGTVATIGVKYDAQIEQYNVAFTTLLGDSEKAAAALDQIKQDAAATPFDTAGLVSANQLLISTGESAEDSRAVIMALGDAVSATGGGNDELSRMAQNLQQVKNVGKASAMDVKQFAMAGIDIYGLLADYTGKSTAEVQEMDITYDMLSQALINASQEGGKFYGAMENQSHTLNGQISTLKDNVQQKLGEAFQSVADLLSNELLPKAINFVNGFDIDALMTKVENFFSVLKQISPVLAAIIGLVTDFYGIFKAMKLADKISSIIGTISEAGGIISALGGPIGIIVAAIAAVIAAVATLYATNEDFRNAVNSFLSDVADKVKAVWEFIQPFIQTALDFIKQTFQNIIDSLKPVIENIIAAFQNAWELIKMVWDTVSPFFIGVFGAVWATVKTVAKEIGDALTLAWTVIKAVWDVVTGYFAAVWNTIAGIFAVVKDVLSGDFSGAWEAIKGILSGWGEFFLGLWDDVKSIFSGVIEFFSSVGQDVVDGIKEGIDSAWEGLKSFVKNLWEGVKGIFHIGKGDVTVEGGTVSGSHAGGLDYVPYNDYVANLHRGEMVLTATEADAYRKNERRSSGGVTVVQNIYSKAQTAADLMREAKWEQERAVMMGV